MFKLPIKSFWDRTPKSTYGSTHVLRDALRNYIDVLYSNPNPESLEQAYKELKKLSPEVEKELRLGVR